MAQTLDVGLLVFGLALCLQSQLSIATKTDNGDLRLNSELLTDSQDNSAHNAAITKRRALDRDAADAILAQIKRLSFRTDLGKRSSPLEEDDDDVTSDVDDKRFAGFRADLGKRPSGFRSDLGKRFSSFRSDLGKRYSGFRADLGKRYSGFNTDLGKRYSSFNADLGKRAAFRYDLGKRSDEDDLSEQDKRFSGFRADLGKRYSGFRADLGKREFDLDDAEEQAANKRYSGFRADLGKRLFRNDLGKRAGFRYDLGKRAFRADLGKRSAEDTMAEGPEK